MESLSQDIEFTTSFEVIGTDSALEAPHTADRPSLPPC